MKTNYPIVDSRATIDTLRETNKALVSALERTLANFKHLLASHPVRDAGETIAEANAALSLAKEEEN